MKFREVGSNNHENRQVSRVCSEIWTFDLLICLYQHFLSSCVLFYVFMTQEFFLIFIWQSFFFCILVTTSLSPLRLTCSTGELRVLSLLLILVKAQRQQLNRRVLQTLAYGVLMATKLWYAFYKEHMMIKRVLIYFHF